MKITFKNLGFSYSIDSIMMFQNQELSNFWMSSLFHFFPSLDREKLSSLDALEKNLKIIDKAIEKNIKGLCDNEFNILKSISGIGVVYASRYYC